MYSESNGWAYSWIIKIYGKLSTIPVLLERKKMQDSKKYNSLNNTFSFNIEYAGEDDFYGFVLDGNHRFLLADTTVSHNTWALIDVGVTAMMNGLKVLHCSLEMSESQMLKRYWTCMSGQVNEDKDDIAQCCYIKLKIKNEMLDEKFDQKGCIEMSGNDFIAEDFDFGDYVDDIKTFIELNNTNITVKKISIDCSSKYLQFVAISLILFLL